MTEFQDLPRADSFELYPAAIIPNDGGAYPALSMKFWLNNSEDEPLGVTLLGTHQFFKRFQEELASAINRSNAQVRATLKEQQQ